MENEIFRINPEEVDWAATKHYIILTGPRARAREPLNTPSRRDERKCRG